MKKIIKIFDMIFTVRNFLILLCVIALICVIKISGIKENNQKKAETRLTDFSMDSYKNGYMARFDTIMDYCKIDDEQLDGIVVGLSSGEQLLEDRWSEYDVIKYYIKDKEAIDKVLSGLRKLQFCCMTDSADDFVHDEINWDVVVYPGATQNIALRVKANGTAEKNCYRTETYVAHKNNGKEWQQQIFVDMDEEIGRYHIVNTAEMEKLLQEIVDEYVRKVTMEEVIDVCLQEKVDLSILFGYTHGSTEFGEQGEDNSKVVFEFPIEGKDGYVVLEKSNMTINSVPETDIIRLELWDSEGTSINLLEASEEEVKAFFD